MRIGQLAERTGVSVKALRFYEEQGILPEPARGAGRGGGDGWHGRRSARGSSSGDSSE
jgi:hypothetical protein